MEVRNEGREEGKEKEGRTAIIIGGNRKKGGRERGRKEGKEGRKEGRRK